MKYVCAVAMYATLLSGCRKDREPPEVTASTRWRKVPEWQLIHGDGRNDAVFDPHTSLYCSFKMDSTGQQHQFCVVMAPDSAMAEAIQWDTAYIQMAVNRMRVTDDSLTRAAKAR